MLALKKHLPWFIFILSLIVLYLSSYPAIGWWDSSINAANAYDLSIPDPGGSILYVILGRLFTILFFFLPAIKAITLVSIVSTSAASVFFYYCMIEVLNNFNKSSESSKIIASFFTALSLPLLFSIWSESNVSRVYSLGLLLASIILLCALKIWLTGGYNIIACFSLKKTFIRHKILAAANFSCRCGFIYTYISFSTLNANSTFPNG